MYSIVVRKPRTLQTVPSPIFQMPTSPIHRYYNIIDYIPQAVPLCNYSVLPICTSFFLSSFFFFKKKIYLFLESEEGREKERGRGIRVWEIHWLVASCMHPNWGPGPQPRHVPWLAIEPVMFWFSGQCSTHWATPVRARQWVFLSAHNCTQVQYRIHSWKWNFWVKILN